jgi:DNA repair exonuclease SbcCD ATPase subunit
MEERIRSLADVIDTATSEAVKEMSTLFEPEMQRLRGQFEASMETDSKMSALQEQVQKLTEGGGAPSSQAASAVETEVGQLRHRMQSLEQDLQIMLQNSDSGPTAGFATAGVGGGSAGVDELRKMVEAKLAAFERAHKLQQQNREMLEEQVFAVRRSLPTIDRLASTIRESLESQQSAEQELLALKSTVEKQSGGGDALTALLLRVDTEPVRDVQAGLPH